MKQIRKEKLYWICQLGGWFLFTVLEVSNYLNMDGFRVSLLVNGCINFLLGILVTHLYRIFIIKMGWLQMPLYLIIPRGILGVIIMSLLLTFINIPLDRITYPIFQSVPLDVGLFSSYFFNLSKYILLWTLTYHLFQYWERSLKAERDRFQIEAVLKETQYNSLKTQLNPHFLFNSLNSIRTLIDMNPELSKTAITQLSNLLRSSLQMGKNKTVALKDELQTIKDYLAIEKIRFDDRLLVFFDIDAQTELVQVPPMMLQTLCENAIKHGISASKQGGEIHIQSRIQDDQLTVHISNSGKYQPKAHHEGVGIQNTLERLQLLYDDKAYLHISNADDNTVLTEIVIPINV
jgi:two-component system, LytTR family, sensor kinase